MTPTTLKAQLRAIHAADTLPDDVDVAALTAAMVAHIGSPDMELREDLIYGTLARWFGAVVGAAEMRILLPTLLDDAHLFYQIGEYEGESVFTRSFSMLAIALILYQHREQAFLSADEVQGVLNRVLDYARQEQDRRGYTEPAGWAHSIAHLADVLDELALCTELGAEELRHILEAVQHTMTTADTLYHHEEDERMAFATLNLYERTLISEAEFTEWLKGLSENLLPRRPWTRESYNQRVNLKQFLRSLYLQALNRAHTETVRPAILAAERTVTLYSG